MNITREGSPIAARGA